MFFLRPILLTTALLAAALASAGCDEIGATVSDSEAIEGSWTGSSLNVRLSVASGVSVPVPGLNVSVATVRFSNPNEVSFRFDPADDAMLAIPQTSISIPLPDEAILSGTYTLDDGNDRISVTRPGVAQTLVLQYRFRGDDDLEIIAEDAVTLAALLGLAGPEAAQLAGLVSGGSIRYTK